MVSVLEWKNTFWNLSGYFEWYQCKNIAELRLTHVRGFNFVCLVIPKQILLV